MPSKCRAVGGPPIVEQIIQLRVKMLGRGIPRLQEKIIDVGFVDGADGGIGVGIGGEQGALGVGEDAHAFLEKRHTVHVRHALVGQQEGHAIVADFQLFEERERAFGGIASDHAVFGAVFRAQIALDGAQNIGVVVNTQQYWFRP